MAGQRRIGGERPKIAALLGRPEAEPARQELNLARRLGVAPSYLRGRRQVTTYEYDDAGRMVRSITGSPWTPEDRALLIALEKHEARFCDKCGQPKDTAWHPDNDGYFEVTAEVTCWGCTTLQNHGAPADSQHPVQYLTVTDTRDYQASPLPPVQLAPVAGSTPAAATTAPTDAPLGG